MSVEVNGAKVLFEIPIFGGVEITQAVVNTELLLLYTALAALLLTRGMRLRNIGMRQTIAETLVRRIEMLAAQNIGSGDDCAFVAALLIFPLLSGLMGVVGSFAPTADLSTCLGWALVVFAKITARKIRRRRFSGYLRSFIRPAAFMTPINIISEASLPVSMAFRMFGNMASGALVMLLVYSTLYALGGYLLQIGVPAVFSLYFDVFSSAFQAFIFCMLAMVYIRLAEE